jgi:hypothetical protein
LVRFGEKKNIGRQGVPALIGVNAEQIFS